MKKYWALFKVQWQAMLAYRAQILIWFFIAVFQTVFLLYLWIAVYQQGGKIGNYSFEELFTYYFLQLVITQIVATYISWDMIEEIKFGNFSQYLLKPINYFKWQAVVNFSVKSSEIAVIIFGLAAAGLFMAKYALGPASSAALLHSIILTLLAFFMVFIMEFIIGIGAFWLTNAYSFRFLIYTIGRLFSGGLIPLDLLPKPLFEISQFLPFPFFSYIPAQVYLGRIENTGFMYLIGAVWLIALYALARFFYKLSIKRYEAVGS